MYTDVEKCKENIQISNNDVLNFLNKFDWKNLVTDKNRLEALRMAIVHSLGEMNRNQNDLFENRFLDWDKKEYDKLYKETVMIQRLLQKKISDFQLKYLDMSQGDLLIKLNISFDDNYMKFFSKLDLRRMSKVEKPQTLASYLVEDIILSKLEFTFKDTKSFVFDRDEIKIAVAEETKEVSYGLLNKKEKIVSELQWISIDSKIFLKMMLQIKHPDNPILTDEIVSGFRKALAQLEN